VWKYLSDATNINTVGCSDRANILKNTIRRRKKKIEEEKRNKKQEGNKQGDNLVQKQESTRQGSWM
jgi:NADH:ubiquinone oxidoreductase subunit B-like Fe-S oxidoreductase